MKGKLKIVSVTVLMVLLCFVALFVHNSINNVYASEHEFEVENNVSEEIVERGIFTSLSLSIDGGDGKVWATVRNDITIFPATVYVIVQLYSSDVYYESYTDMELIASNYTKDLNMGETVTATASTNGQQKYWKARTYYKIDSQAWAAKVTNTWLVGADGILII